MPKVTRTSSDQRQQRRHNPLAEEYAPTGPLKQKAGKKRKLTQEDKNDASYVDTKASQRILQIGQDLIDEDQTERQASEPNPAFAPESRFVSTEEDDSFEAFDDDEDAWGDEEGDVVEEVEVDPNDQDIFNRFHPSNEPDPATLFDNGDDDGAAQEEGTGTNLTELILEKIAAHEAAVAGGAGTEQPSNLRGDSPMEDEPLDPKVIEVYTKVGQILSRYRSGKLPKPFKILPSLSASEIPLIVSITRPEEWTPHALLAATRLFISSKPAVAQPFLHTILLPRVRDDIHEHRKLNAHLYAALKKALYKPACFFKGFLFPLLEDGTCTLREADIISSVVARVSVPVLHSAAALLRLCDIAAEQFSTSKEDGGGGATNVFIRVLLEKKYALPYRVVDALVFHFMRFKAMNTTVDAGDGDVSMHGAAAPRKTPSRRLPVLWHQCFLVFAQRYRNDITEDQREALMDLVTAVGHRDMGPETRRELLQGRGRGVPVAADGAVGYDGDDTMALN